MNFKINEISFHAVSFVLLNYCNWIDVQVHTVFVHVSLYAIFRDVPTYSRAFAVFRRMKCTFLALKSN